MFFWKFWTIFLLWLELSLKGKIIRPADVSIWATLSLQNQRRTLYEDLTGPSFRLLILNCFFFCYCVSWFQHLEKKGNDRNLVLQMQKKRTENKHCEQQKIDNRYFELQTFSIRQHLQLKISANQQKVGLTVPKNRDKYWASLNL